ncbi:MAG: TIR domain-containing protein [Granulosicoccus sp.]
MSLYNIDLFISYAHIDNVPLSAQKSGWISRFHESLSAHLSMKLGKRVRIWRDDKLQGNDRFAEEIVEQFNSTAVLVSVLTPRYLNSEWCTREVAEFCKKAENNLFVENKARIFKVIKTPVDSESSLPSIMQELLGYDFFIFEDGAPVALDDVYGEQYGQDFNRKVNGLSFQIAELLKTLEAANDEHKIKTSVASPDKPVVYLAECAYDMKSVRDNLETQLNCLGYQVLPDRSLPVDEEGYINAVNALLTRSDVSVHLIGQQYGAVPHGPNDESTAHVQNRLAASMSQYTSLTRLIWLGNQSSPSDEKQQRFIHALQSDAQSQSGADLLNGDVEQLKSVLQTLLDKVEIQNNPDTGQADNIDTETTEADSSVYLICTEQDRKATQPLRKYLRDHDISVLMPAFKGDAAEVRQANQQRMSNSRSIMIFYGEGEEAWKRSVDTEIRKLPAYLDGRDMPSVYTYLAAPQSCDKDDIVDMEEQGTINGLESLNEIALDKVFALSGTAHDIT